LRILKQDNECIITMGREDVLRLHVPASDERVSVHLRVARNGKLTISGNSKFVESISGPGMKDKIEE
jgi:hypothetical protein